MVLGSFLGVQLHRISPDILILICLTSVVFISALLTIYKHSKQYKFEKFLENHPNRDGLLSDLRLSHIDKLLLTSTIKIQYERETMTINKADLIQYELSCKERVLYILMLLINPIMSLFRGSVKFPSIIGNRLCSKLDFWILVIYSLIVLLLTVVCVREIRRKNYGIFQSERSVSFSSIFYVIKIIVLMFFVGMLGSYLSASISALFTLLFLYLGLSSFVAGPTSLLLTNLVTGSSTLLYWLENDVDMVTEAILGSIVVIVTIATRLWVYKRVLEGKKESVILFFMIILLMITLVCNSFVSLIGIQKEKSSGKSVWDWKYENYCQI